MDYERQKIRTVTDWWLLEFEGGEDYGKFVFGIVVEDTSDRLQPGHWACSTPVLTYRDNGASAETKNTVYVLSGPGREETVPLRFLTAITSGLNPDEIRELEAQDLSISGDH